MNVIRHDDITTYRPTVALVRGAPFVDQNFGNLIASKKWPPIAGACCQKINRRGDPDAFEAPQMFMH